MRRAFALASIVCIACETGATRPVPTVETAAVPQSSAPAVVETTPAPKTSAAPPPSDGGGHWRALASSRRGAFTLRCEGTPEHPTDVAGGCACGSIILNPCEAMRPRHDVDRRQCMFTCDDETAKSFRLRCPDGAKPTQDAMGCGCGGAEQVLNPCGGLRPSSVSISGEVCVVGC